MSQEIKESLLYDYNHNLFVIKTMLPNMRNMQDRQNVVRWLRFLKTSAKTIDEMKLRNDFMYYIVLGIQEDSLKPPFDKPPPNMSLMSMATLLPYADADTDGQEFSTRKSHATYAAGAGASTRTAEIIRRSPDGGEFLVNQPIPAVGAFCYLAVVTKKRD